ncbi:Hypothetical predicted protein, partial [Lynx pardinus]
GISNYLWNALGEGSPVSRLLAGGEPQSTFPHKSSEDIPGATILDDFLLQITAACLLFPSSTTRNWGFKKTECIHTEHKSLCQEGNHRAYQERCVPVMSAIPGMLKYEINERAYCFKILNAESGLFLLRHVLNSVCHLLLFLDMKNLEEYAVSGTPSKPLTNMC